MKRIFLSFVMLLVGCSSTASDDQDAKDATESFYKSYLSAFGSDDARPYPADELRKYVSADTIARIDAIQEIYEQELIESDYFTYTQDYSREWIPALRVENARPFLNGEVVHLWYGHCNCLVTQRLQQYPPCSAPPIQPAHRRVFYTFHSSFPCRCKP
ncbi:TPA: DUF3828 domain-containing protein [Enterobacter sichuanensis]|nr:DUF3828 domain-containing protein [Enterobacter sichuanensis]